MDRHDGRSKRGRSTTHIKDTSVSPSCCYGMTRWSCSYLLNNLHYKTHQINVLHFNIHHSNSSFHSFMFIIIWYKLDTIIILTSLLVPSLGKGSPSLPELSIKYYQLWKCFILSNVAESLFVSIMLQLQLILLENVSYFQCSMQLSEINI